MDRYETKIQQINRNRSCMMEKRSLYHWLSILESLPDDSRSDSRCIFREQRCLYRDVIIIVDLCDQFLLQTGSQKIPSYLQLV